MKTLKDQLKQWKKKNMALKRRKQQPEEGERFWAEMMGVRRPTYKRHKGAFRQK
ncbi:hypothetical protein WD019_15300 [Fictibacillus sp. Mic-4]|uniref:hypothetical protein n=1 Tax=Fictibacillus sp. Mic-4 TaxID=3132826 RepID=UPI003CF2DD60